MESLRDRLDNLEQLVRELIEGEISPEEIESQANYHSVTIELLKIELAQIK